MISHEDNILVNEDITIIFFDIKDYRQEILEIEAIENSLDEEEEYL